MGKLIVSTLVDHRPDFLPLQKRSFDKFIAVTHKFLPLVNSFSRLRTHVNFSTINELGLEALKVKRDPAIEIKNRRPAFGLSGYLDPAMACAFGMQWFWSKVLPSLTNDLLLFIDSDMFLISEFDPEKILSDRSFSFIPQFRGDIIYPYAGVFLARIQDNSYEKFSWFPGRIDGKNTDVGGRAHVWCRQNIEKENVRELIMLSIRSATGKGNCIRIESQINGNFNFIIEYNVDSGISSVVSHDNTEDISGFWQSESPLIELASIASEVARLFLSTQDFDWPSPHYFDFIGVRENRSFQPFIFHYKSGSNYQPWSTASYNLAKTEALISFAFGSNQAKSS